MRLRLLLFTLLATIVLAACSNNNPAIETLSAEDFELKLQQTSAPQLVDVRTPEEFGESHIAGALNIDVNGGGFEESIAILDKGRPIFVYCRGGNRSMKAAAILEKHGYKPIYNMAGGITEWKEKGKAVESGVTDYRRFSFSGYAVRLVSSDTYAIQKSSNPIQYSEREEDGILHMTITDQRGRVPKDTITLYVKEDIEYLSLHNGELIMNEVIKCDSLRSVFSVSRGDLKIEAEYLSINVGGGGSVKLFGNSRFTIFEVGAASHLDASEFLVKEATADVMGYSSARVNVEKLTVLNSENGTLKNLYSR